MWTKRQRQNYLLKTPTIKLLPYSQSPNPQSQKPVRCQSLSVKSVLLRPDTHPHDTGLPFIALSTTELSSTTRIGVVTFPLPRLVTWATCVWTGAIRWPRPVSSIYFLTHTVGLLTSTARWWMGGGWRGTWLQWRNRKISPADIFLDRFVTL